MKVVIVGVSPFSILNFRGDLIDLLTIKGHTVYALASGASILQKEEFKKKVLSTLTIKVNEEVLLIYFHFFTLH